jgi:putative membrane protein
MMYGMGFGWLWVLLLAVGAVALAWGLSRAWNAPGAGRDEADRARQILRERFARGEITEEEFRQRLRTLDGG